MEINFPIGSITCATLTIAFGTYLIHAYDRGEIRTIGRSTRIYTRTENPSEFVFWMSLESFLFIALLSLSVYLIAVHFSM